MSDSNRRAVDAYKRAQGLLKAVDSNGNAAGTKGKESGRPVSDAAGGRSGRSASKEASDASRSTTPSSGTPATAALAARGNVTDIARYLALIGREEAAAVLRHLPEDEAQRILDTMAHLPPISRREALRVLGRFHAAIPVPGGETRVGPEAAREILVRAFGPADGDRRFYEILPDERPARFAFLAEAEGRQLSMLIRNESAATLAIICSNMPKPAAGRLLAALEGEQRTAVIRRIAGIGPVAPEALDAIESTLRRRLESIQRPETEEIDGEAKLAEILRYMDLTSSDHILHDLGENDADLEEHIRAQLNSPEDLLYMTNRDVQKILQRVDDVDIAVLMKGKSPDVVSRITENLSERRREMVQMHRETLGPMRRRDVDRVTSDFMNLVREMALAGDVVVRVPGSDEWVE
ncbi:MAG: flagellar motor switch protein FliG [Alkalispirochaeta sp.]